MKLRVLLIINRKGDGTFSVQVSGEASAMGASSSSNGARPPTSISASEHEAAVSSTHTRSANDKGRQRAHQHGEDQPRLQVPPAPLRRVKDIA